MNNAPLLGVIGGSGLYDIAGFSDVEAMSLSTPWGTPSDDIVVGTLAGTRTAFLPRHGKGHRFTPSEVNYRANVAALKQLGCRFVLSVSAVGSMQEQIEPGHLVVVDQFIDRTVGRARSFFGDGIVGHVGFADPVCPTLRAIVLDAAKQTTTPTHDGGTYICIEGPQFSTRAESKLFRSWGVSVIGMTNLPEARLAREAGLSYATLALATDYDCWRDDEEAVSVEAVMAVMQKNIAAAKDVVRNVAAALAAPGAPSTSLYADVLAHAVMTSPAARALEAKRKLRHIAGDLIG
ncbi:MAG TPA: S-methyl-5'-thioadenosine phosphorylase [Myxococcota bacterium]